MKLINISKPKSLHALLYQFVKLEKQSCSPMSKMYNPRDLYIVIYRDATAVNDEILHSLIFGWHGCIPSHNI